MKKKKITREQLEKYINSMKEYRDSVHYYIEELQQTLRTFTEDSNPPTPPPKPPILK